MENARRVRTRVPRRHRGSSTTPPARGPAWSRPARPELTRLLAGPLLLSGGVLLALATMLLPQVDTSVWSYALAAGLVVHGAVVRWSRARSRVGDLAVATAALSAIAAVGGGAVLIGPEQHGWAILMTIPVTYATSQFEPAFGAVVTAGTCAAAVAVLLRQHPPGAVGLVVDAVLVCSALVMLAVLVARVTQHLDRLMAELHHLAAIDGLTGLVSRRVLDEALEAALDAASTSAGAALVLVDLDHFKSVNDRYGHPVGDAALQHVAGLLSAAVRTTDAVVSRFGGDELAVLLPGCPVLAASARADDLVDAVRGAPLQLPDGTLLALTVSVGVAHAPDHALDVRALYSAADAALYRAKREGRDRAATAPGSATPPRRVVQPQA